MRIYKISLNYTPAVQGRDHIGRPEKRQLNMRINR
jgi:hypothetical protein